MINSTALIILAHIILNSTIFGLLIYVAVLILRKKTIIRAILGYFVLFISPVVVCSLYYNLISNINIWKQQEQEKILENQLNKMPVAWRNLYNQSHKLDSETRKALVKHILSEYKTLFPQCNYDQLLPFIDKGMLDSVKPFIKEFHDKFEIK